MPRECNAMPTVEARMDLRSVMIPGRNLCLYECERSGKVLAPPHKFLSGSNSGNIRRFRG
jgi:hypothetical protein